MVLTRMIQDGRVKGDLLSDVSYKILKEDDIKRRLDEAISSVCSVLSLARATACILLHHCNWSADSVYDKWFSDEKQVRKVLGLLEIESSLVLCSSSEVVCGICFEIQQLDGTFSAVCGHLFCKSCWKLYIRTAVDDGPGCLNLRCPEPSCGEGDGGAAVGIDMIESLGSSDEIKRYHQFLLRSYVEDRRNCKWCPAAGCPFAVECHGSGDGSYVVTCRCSHSFCWNCGEEKHRPVICEMVADWAQKMLAESSNTEWILTFTKPCPKCKRPIEKNQGCNRMTCPAPCGFQFCWLCLSDWSVHGYDTCNRYSPAEEFQKAKARRTTERYTHYYERWISNHKSSRKAADYLTRIEIMHKEKLCEMHRSKNLIDFVIEAWKQIVECRTILKWSYTYGYYLPEEESVKQQFFEFLQGQAELGLERLHQCAEQELQSYYLHGASENFTHFHSKLKDLTSITRQYFENLVSALENGLTEIDSSLKQSSKRLRVAKSVTFDLAIQSP